MLIWFDCVEIIHYCERTNLSFYPSLYLNLFLLVVLSLLWLLAFLFLWTVTWMSSWAILCSAQLALTASPWQQTLLCTLLLRIWVSWLVRLRWGSCPPLRRDCKSFTRCRMNHGSVQREHQQVFSSTPLTRKRPDWAALPHAILGWCTDQLVGKELVAEGQQVVLEILTHQKTPEHLPMDREEAKWQVLLSAGKGFRSPQGHPGFWDQRNLQAQGWWALLAQQRHRS